MKKLNEMHAVYEEIKEYQIDGNGTRLEQILQSKSINNEWNDPQIYSYSIKKEYKEHQMVNFLGFLDWTIIDSDNMDNIELDGSRHYYAIQIMQNSRIIQRLHSKHHCLLKFIRMLKELVQKNSFQSSITDLNRVIDLCDDFAQIIIKEIELYLFLTFPKDKYLRGRTEYTQFQGSVNKQDQLQISNHNSHNFQQKPNSLKNSITNQQNQIKSQLIQMSPQVEYLVSQVQNNMSLFCKLFSQISQMNKQSKFEFVFPQACTLKLTREEYLCVISIIVNAVMTFGEYCQQFRITFSNKNNLQLKIQKTAATILKDERMEKNNTSIETSFENILSKIHKSSPSPFQYQKSYDQTILVYTVDLSDKPELHLLPDNINLQLSNQIPSSFNRDIQESSYQLKSPNIINHDNQTLGGFLGFDKNSLLVKHGNKQLTFLQSNDPTSLISSNRQRINSNDY